MASLHFNPTTMVLIQAQLAGFYKEQDETESARAAIRKAAELVREDYKQEFTAGAEFLRIENAKKMLTNAPESNHDLLRFAVEKMDHAYMEIVNEVLQ